MSTLMHLPPDWQALCATGCLYAAFVTTALVALLGLTAHVPLTVIRRLYGVGAGWMAGALGWLGYFFYVSDMTFVVVASHSHAHTPVLYKLSAVWGQHEGALLLWILFFMLYGIFYVYTTRLPEQVIRTILGLHSALALFFVTFSIVTSDPFLRSATPLMGRDLNPILQDPSLTFHPPLLYLGYVGYGLVWVLAMGACWFPDISMRAELRRVALIPLGFLTVGMTLGSFWAYYELGWGGYWFWDPVENAALLPWLTGAMLVHLLTRSSAASLGMVAVALMTFTMSVLGTFLVRSGLLTTVHAFADDQGRGAWLLGLWVFMIILSIFFWGRYRMVRVQPFVRLPRSVFVYGAVLGLGMMLCVVIWGTFYPLIYQMVTHHPMHVGEGFFQGVLKILSFFGLTAMLVYEMRLLPLSVRLWAGVGCGASMLSAWLVLWMAADPEQCVSMTGVLVGLALGVCVVTVWRLIIARRQDIWAHALGHVGMGVLCLGVCLHSILGRTYFVILAEGEQIQKDHLTLHVLQASFYEAPNYRSIQLEVGINAHHLITERRYYPARNQETTEMGLKATDFLWLSDYTVTVGEEVKPRTFEIWVKTHPFVRLIWIGGMLAALGMLWGGVKRMRRMRGAI